MSDSSSTENSVPKQYLPLLGKPVLLRSIQAIANVAGVERIVVVLHPEDKHWHAIDSAAINTRAPVVTVTGSHTRAGSVLAGLAHILDWVGAAELSDDVQVLVHDAARPLVRPQTIENLVQQVARHQSCGGLLATPASDTLKITHASSGDEETALKAVKKTVIKTLDRDLVWQAQTPQLFGASQLHDAIQAAVASGSPVTDEASAMEIAGFHPLLVAGDDDNIKLTRSLDIPLAEILLRAQEAE